MSLQSTFWHKGQRDTIGSRVVWADPTVAAHGSTAGNITSSAFNYTISSTNGKVYTKSAETNLDLTDGLSLPHENNPTLTVTDDRSTTSRTERQNLEALVVPSGSFAKAILTVDAAGALRGYAGEVVTTSLASAKFPVLDLDDECPFWAMEITGAYTAGTTAFGTNNTNYAIVGMP